MQRNSGTTQLLPAGMASSRSTGNSVLHTTTSATDSVSCSTKEWSCAPRWPRLRAAFPTNAWDSPTHPGQVRCASPHQAPLDVAQRFPQRLHARSAVHQVGIQGRQRGRLRADGRSRPCRTAAPPRRPALTCSSVASHSSHWVVRSVGCSPRRRKKYLRDRGTERGNGGGEGGGRTDSPGLTGRWHWGRRAPRRSPAAGRGPMGDTAGTAAALRDGAPVRGGGPRRPSGPAKASPPPPQRPRGRPHLRARPSRAAPERRRSVRPPPPSAPRDCLPPPAAAWLRADATRNAPRGSTRTLARRVFEDLARRVLVGH